MTLEGEGLAQRSAKLAALWKTWAKVDMVQVDSAWVQRLEAILRFARASLLFLALVVAVAVLAAVFNTVRMQALSQREEIGVARLVGATESFVRRPFLYLGAISCGVAALAAIGLVALVLDPLNAALADLARSYGTEFALRLPQWEWLAAFVVGVALLGRCPRAGRSPGTPASDPPAPPRRGARSPGRQRLSSSLQSPFSASPRLSQSTRARTRGRAPRVRGNNAFKASSGSR